MKHGKLLLATFGAVLVVVGVVLAVFDRWSGGVLAGVIGAVLLVLGRSIARVWRCLTCGASPA